MSHKKGVLFIPNKKVNHTFFNFTVKQNQNFEINCIYTLFSHNF